MADGFRSQPRWLKALLIASLAAVAVGVVRCSLEMTTPRAPIRTIAIAPVAVDVPPELFSSPRDSLGRAVSRQFARSLRELTALPVSVAASDTGGADAVVRLALRSRRGQALVSCVVTERAVDRVVVRVSLEGPAKMLYATLAVAARRVATGLEPTHAARGRGAAP